MASRLARRALVFTAIWGGWTMIGLLALGPKILGRLFQGGAPVPHGLAVYNIEHVWLWAVYTPGIVWLAARYPITRRTLWNVPRHIALALAVQVMDILIDRAILPLFGLHYQEPFFTTFSEQLFVNLFCYLLVLLAGLAIANARQLNERRLRASQLAGELAHAQLRALEMQLRPHFLFNALHSIGALIRGGDSQAAIGILAELGDLLRAILRDDGRHEATVSDELELALQYLRIEEVRFGDRLEARAAVTVEALAAFVPRLILQPLLENAVRHGVERSPGKTRIDLRGTVEDGLVWLWVRDHGGAGGRQDGHGIGLANTRARLERLYGGEYRLELAATAEGGFMARIGIPYHLQPVQVAGSADGECPS